MDQFKDLLCYLCLPGSESSMLVSYTRDSKFEYINVFTKHFSKFSRIHLGKTRFVQFLSIENVVKIDYGALISTHFHIKLKYHFSFPGTDSNKNNFYYL